MFYDNFYSLCQKAGVTPTQVARDLGIRQSTVSMWKKQASTPRYETLQKLADYFGVSINTLLDGDTAGTISAAIDIAMNSMRSDLRGQTQTFQPFTKTDDELLKLGGFGALSEFYSLPEDAQKEALKDIHGFVEYTIAKYKKQSDSTAEDK